jgi:hypothetical protein
MPPEDGRLTPETCRGFKTLQSECDSEIVLSWLRYCEYLGGLYFPPSSIRVIRSRRRWERCVARMGRRKMRIRFGK